MSKRLDEIVVVDVESTCWRGDPPDGQQNDIIEIGVCLLNIRTGERTKKEGMIVIPERSRVSTFCTELTTLTQEQVDAGIDFQSACQQLRKQYRTRDRAWASYGDYDRCQFERQCNAMNVPYPFGRTHWNIKSLLAIAIPLSREVGAKAALEQFGYEFEGTHHRGIDDAWNIAKVLWALLEKFRE